MAKERRKYLTKIVKHPYCRNKTCNDGYITGTGLACVFCNPWLSRKKVNIPFEHSSAAYNMDAMMGTRFGY